MLLTEHEQALEDAQKCIAAQERWAKGYARKAAALNALERYSETKAVCVTGFVLQDRNLCKVFVDSWLEASRALVSPKFDALKVLRGPTSFQKHLTYSVMSTVSCCFNKQLSDAQGMSHQQMEECVMGALQIMQNGVSPLLEGVGGGSCHPIRVTPEEEAMDIFFHC
jgi:hypothetical protein